MSTAANTFWRATVDKIIISDLLVRTIIGVNDHERINRQDVVINCSLSVDLSASGKSDRLEDSVDYRALNKKIVAMAEHSKFFLVEALAQAIADICLEDPAVQEARVRVEKPGALRFARTVGVEITRQQAG
jgi:FolB domain-containing protein